MKLTENIIKVIDIMNKKGYRVYAVGGCVRDSVMGIEPHDYDLTTNATPEETLSCFSDYHCITSGIKHGTVAVVINGEVVEITTFRIESEYSDNRHPDSVVFTSDLTDDLKRRDFTVNAIAYDYYTNELKDPFGGCDDIKNKLIRCVGNADERFNEDGLRILRALRFSSVLGFEIEKETAESIHKNKELLKNISAERIYTEFTKLLCGKNAGNVLRAFYDVVAVFIPEILPTVGFDQQNIHHCFDVYEHTVVTVESIEADPVLRWTMLLHDLGKPASFFTDEKGGHFHGHYKISCEIAKDLLTRLKASNDMIKTVSTLVYYHDGVIQENEKSLRRLIVKLGEENTRRMLKIQRADAMGQASYQLKERLLHIDKLSSITAKLLSEPPCFCVKDLAINGDDLISIGIFPGVKMGQILKKLLDEVTEGTCQNERSELLKKAKEL